MVPSLPFELMDYILKFNEEWKMIGNQFINIKKLSQIPRPKQINGFGVHLLFYPKSYLLYFSTNNYHFVSVIHWTRKENSPGHNSEIKEYNYLSDTTNKWILTLMN